MIVSFPFQGTADPEECLFKGSHENTLAILRIEAPGCREVKTL
jgi:hypothetical protein